MKSSMLINVFGLLAGLAAAAPTSPQTTELGQRSLDINTLLATIIDTFAGLDATVRDVCGALTYGEKALATVFGINPTSHRSGCSDVTLIFARGTCDPGNMGVLVGPPFVAALQSALGGRSLGVQGVDYPASVDGYLNADSSAGQTMANLITSIRGSCPKTKLVLSGYSQGGFAVHNAASNVGSAVMSQVSSVVIFGDPYSHRAVSGIDSSKVMIICHAGDNICDQGPIVLLQHLTYVQDAVRAAKFVVSHI